MYANDRYVGEGHIESYIVHHPRPMIVKNDLGIIRQLNNPVRHSLIILARMPSTSYGQERLNSKEHPKYQLNN